MSLTTKPLNISSYLNTKEEIKQYILALFEETNDVDVIIAGFKEIQVALKLTDQPLTLQSIFDICQQHNVKFIVTT